jgi:hypothetical protein
VHPPTTLITPTLSPRAGEYVVELPEGLGQAVVVLVLVVGIGVRLPSTSSSTSTTTRMTIFDGE